VQVGRVGAHGAQGSAAKWTHAAMVLAIRSLGERGEAGRPDPERVLRIVERVMREGEVRGGAAGADLGPDDARAPLRAWLGSVDLEVNERKLLEHLQEDEISHPDLYRRARRIHERKLANVTREIASHADELDIAASARELFDACIPAIPYAAASAFLGREKQKLARSEGDRPRVALVADGLGGTHGVTRTVQQIRDRGVPGFEVEVIGTDPDVDRRLSAVAEIEVPFYPGLQVGVPSLPAIVDTLAEGRYDMVHLCSPGPAGVGAWLLARVLDLPVLGSYHTELAAYASVRSGLARMEMIALAALAKFYGGCDVVLSPSPATDDRLQSIGIAPERIARWDRGVDVNRFSPAHGEPGLLPRGFNVLYAGRLTTEKGISLLADAFLTARRREPRLHLVLAGGGPEEGERRARLGDAATFLGWLDGDELARAYASADLFLFASQTDTFGQVLLEAQASGLPVVAVDAGGPASLIEHGRTGLLVPPDEDALASAVLTLVQRPPLRAQLSRTALGAVRERTWDAALERLADGYRLALGEDAGAKRRVA
jgi:glycosyltransferase involved in cell wall biosynthesis